MSGWKKESWSFKDASFQKIYGASPDVPIVPLGRDITGIPVVYQGADQTCIACSITWIKQYLELTHPDLSHEFLAKVSNTASDGASPRQVLEPARKEGICSEAVWKSGEDTNQFFDAWLYRIGGYAFLSRLTSQTIYHALQTGPIMVGVDDWNGIGPHMMAGFDVTDDGLRVKCANWWVEDHQDVQEVPFDKITFCCSILNEKPSNNVSMPPLSVLWSKAKTALKTKLVQWIAGVLGVAIVGGGAAVYGSSGIVARFSTTLSSGITNTDSSIAVASVTLTDGESFTSSNLKFPLYLTINPSGSTAEDVECWGLTTKTFTSCGRGLSWLGGSTTSTSSSLKFAHAAGEKVIMSNTPYFYNQFLDMTTNQVIAGIKNFTSGVTVGGTGATGKIAWNGSALTWSNDGVNTYAFSASAPSVLSASSTKGIGITSSMIHINAGTGGGLGYYPSGYLRINTSTHLTWVSATATKFTATSLYGGTTVDNLQVTGMANSDNDVMNRASVDYRTQFAYATGTAWKAITAGQALWVTATSSLNITSSSAVSSTFQFVGIAAASAAAGATATYVRPGGVACNLTSLVPGMNYYLSGTAGQIATTPGTYFARIGRALSATCLLVLEPKFYAKGSSTITGTGDTKITTGFYPAKIRLVVTAAAGGAFTISELDEANLGWRTNLAGGTVSGINRFDFVDAGGTTVGTISARAATTFTINCSSKASTDSALVYWYAESE